MVLITDWTYVVGDAVVKYDDAKVLVQDNDILSTEEVQVRI